MHPRDLLAMLGRLMADHDWMRWSLALSLAAVGTLALTALRAAVHSWLGRRAARTKNRVDDLFVDLLGTTKLLFLASVATLAALASVELPARLEGLLRGVALVICLFQSGVWASRAVRELIDRRFALAAADPAQQTIGSMIALGLRVALWAVLLLVALDNFGIDVTALIAGLGVGAVAVALALQNILGDLFASVSILLDRPFVVGDFIVLDDFMGTVERIGIKTTRVRSLGGEQIVFANNDLLKGRVRNYKLLSERRVLFRIGVTYQTPPEKLEQVPATIRRIIEIQANTRFERTHFASYGDFSLIFEIVYFVLDPDYNRYMDIQHAINLQIHRQFAAAGIEFAYPTQTLIFQPASGAAPRAP